MSPDDPIVTRIVIRRNQSLDHRGFTWVLAVLAVPVGGYVALAATEGMWPILTFCTGVFLIFAAVLYAVMMAGREREVVTVTARHLIVESGRYWPRMRVELDRYWARVEQWGGARPTLALVSRGAVVEIAAALGAPERETLALRLRALVGPDARDRAAVQAAASGWGHSAVRE